MQTNKNGAVMPVATLPTETVNPITYHSAEVRKAMQDVLNSSELFAVLNSDFIPDYSKDGEKSKRHMAIFTQQYTVKQVEETAKISRPVLRQVTRVKVAEVPKDGSLDNMDEAGEDKDGVKLYSPKKLDEFVKWQSVKMEPICNLIPTNRTLAVVFIASETITVNQFAVLAINTLALICENNQINGKPEPIRKTAGINLAFTIGKTQVNTARLGEGIRSALLITDLSKFTDLMLRKIKMSNETGNRTKVFPGLASKLTTK